MGDFSGGLVSRRTSPLVSVVGVQAIGLAGVCLALLMVREPAPAFGALLWAGMAGSAGVAGLAAFYRALATGRMSLVAPIAAVIGSAIPAAIGIFAGDRLGLPQLAGIACALLSVAVVSAVGRDGEARASGVPLAIVAGLGFAGFFLGIDLADQVDPQASAWWLLLAVRLTAVSLALPVLLIWRPGTGWPTRAVLAVMIVAGLGDVGGNLFYIEAQANAPLSIAAVLSSLYPVTTILLARLFLGERLQRRQLVGVTLAIAGLVLIAL
ncbi:MAG TPA: DMT family transporter [Candidatus Limnocylindrales bacterium]|nr:DMT family transporter [Candidatus Limnocylindrales bacterium]